MKHGINTATRRSRLNARLKWRSNDNGSDIGMTKADNTATETQASTQATKTLACYRFSSCNKRHFSW